MDILAYAGVTRVLVRGWDADLLRPDITVFYASVE